MMPRKKEPPSTFASDTARQKDGPQDMNPSSISDSRSDKYKKISASATAKEALPINHHVPTDATKSSAAQNDIVPETTATATATTTTTVTPPDEQAIMIASRCTTNDDDDTIQTLQAVHVHTKLRVGDVVFVRLERFTGILWQAVVVRNHNTRDSAGYRLQYVYDKVQEVIDVGSPKNTQVYHVVVGKDQGQSLSNTTVEIGTRLSIRVGPGELRDATVVGIKADRWRVHYHTSGSCRWISSHPKDNDEYFVLPSQEEEEEEAPTSRRTSKRRRV